MLATHRVKDSDSKTVGFILEDGAFYTDYYLAKNIEEIDNLKIIKYEELESDVELPIILYKDIINLEYNRLLKESPFIRDIQEELSEWKNDPLHKVLQLEGSRQIGKTTELLKFGYKNYDYVIYVNTAVDEYNFIATVIKGGINSLSMDKYCKNAELPHYVNNKNTLLILDEIQASYEAYNSIRSINNNLKCDLIVTGSYLGQTLNKEFFLPAGTISYLRMFPLSFREFCRVFEKHELLDKIDLYGGSSSSEYKELEQLYETYRNIGGYPEIVKNYIQFKDIDICRNVIDDLLETFEKESRNYFKESKETLIFKTVYTEAVHLMCNEKRGSGTKLVEVVTDIVKKSQKSLVSRDEVSSAIQWLIYSGIIGDCNLCNEGDVNYIIPARRMYYMDCGIASYVSTKTGLLTDAIEGFITENFIYSELYRLYAVKYSKSKVKGDVPCFSTYHDYELDFMVLSKDNTVYGIEVKTSKGNSKSLRVFIDKRLIDKGILAEKTSGGRGENFDTIPIYTVGTRFPYESLD